MLKGQQKSILLCLYKQLASANDTLLLRAHLVHLAERGREGRGRGEEGGGEGEKKGEGKGRRRGRGSGKGEGKWREEVGRDWYKTPDHTLRFNRQSPFRKPQPLVL